MPINHANMRRVRDYMAALPPGKVNMKYEVATMDSDGNLGIIYFESDAAMLINDCDTCGCICGYTWALFPDQDAGEVLGLSAEKRSQLFRPKYYYVPGAYTHVDVIAALDSMLDGSDLPVWPEAGA